MHFFPCLHQLCGIVCLSSDHWNHIGPSRSTLPIHWLMVLLTSPPPNPKIKNLHCFAALPPGPTFCALSTILLFTFWQARPRTCSRRVALNTFGKPGFQRYTGDVIIRPQEVKQESSAKAMENPAMLSLAHFANSTPSHKSSAKLCNSSSVGLARPSFLDFYFFVSNHRSSNIFKSWMKHWCFRPRTHRTPWWSARFFAQSISLAQTIGSKKISGHLASTTLRSFWELLGFLNHQYIGVTSPHINLSSILRNSVTSMARCNLATMQRPSRIKSKDATANRVPPSDASWHMHSWHMPNHGMQQHNMFQVEASNARSGSSQRLTYGKSHQGPCFTLAAPITFAPCLAVVFLVALASAQSWDIGFVPIQVAKTLAAGLSPWHSFLFYFFSFRPFLGVQTRLCMSKTTSWFIIKVAPRTWLPIWEGFEIHGNQQSNSNELHRPAVSCTAPLLWKPRQCRSPCFWNK